MRASDAIESSMNQTMPPRPARPLASDLVRIARPLAFLSLASVALWLWVWHARSVGRLSIAEPLCAIGFVVVCAAYGMLFEHFTGGLLRNRVGVLYRLLTGFFVFNTLLFILTLATPLGVTGNVAILALLPLVALALIFRAKGRPAIKAIDELPGLICVLVVGAAATLWASELQPVMEIGDRLVVFRSWFDIFIHAREISAFAQAHGWSSMADIKMAGAPAPAYHFASYVSTAAFTAFTSTSAIANFGGFQLPFGILLMAIAAFVLVGTVWSPWPGVAAAVALVTLPDAYQQGFGAGYLGFHFMSQVNVTMLYGLACISIAWIFMIEGCRRANYRAVIVAYGFLALTLFYKAHVFVANAYLILIFPCLFFTQVKLRWRIVAVLAFTALFFTVVEISQMSAKVPTLRLNGSGMATYMRILFLGFDPGPLKGALWWLLFRNQHGMLINGAIATLLILFGSFGAWTLIAPVVFWKTRNRLPPRVLGFVILVVANYFVMSLGLAIDARLIGSSEELLNRPMAWAYFVLVSFACAGLYQLAFGNAAPPSRRLRGALVALIAVSLTSVWFLSRNAQTLRPLPGFGSYAQFNAVPLCEVRAAQYLRDHSRAGEVMQDSQDDANFVSTAIAERQLYIARSAFAGKTPGWEDRLRAIDAIEQRGDVAALEGLAARDHIDWLLLHPEDADRWPRSFLDRAAFECNGYRVIRLTSR